MTLCCSKARWTHPCIVLDELCSAGETEGRERLRGVGVGGGGAADESRLAVSSERLLIWQMRDPLYGKFRTLPPIYGKCATHHMASLGPYPHMASLVPLPIGGVRTCSSRVSTESRNGT